jgi:hypothetical protein
MAKSFKSYPQKGYVIFFTSSFLSEKMQNAKINLYLSCYNTEQSIHAKEGAQSELL